MRSWLPTLAMAAALAAPVPASPSPAPSGGLAFPADAGAINVRDFGAKGDGKTDDTAALRAAFTASGADTGVLWWHDRIVFLPAGTYLVSDTLSKRYRDGRFASGLALQGEGPGRTVIRLIDHAPGFQNPAAPRGIVMTTSKLLDTGGSRDYVGKGEGNDAYENFVEGLTVDAGADNPGAIGIDYLANNLGAIRNVVVRAEAGSGAIGIGMLRQVPGPALIQDTTVKGFRTGISLGDNLYGMTLSDVSLEDQAETGLIDDGNILSAERLTVARPGKTGLTSLRPGGLVTLVDSAIEGTVANNGTLGLRGTEATLPGAERAKLDGVVRGEAALDPAAHDVSLQRAAIPTVDPGPARAWVGVSGATEDKPVDNTAALQRALNSGARTVYLRHGTFWLSDTVTIPPGVHRILGMNSTIRVFPQRKPGFSHESPLLRVSGDGGPLEIDHLAMDNSNLGGQLGIEGRTPRPLLLRDILTAGVTMLDRGRFGGPAALEDVCCGTLQVAGAAPVTARQFNTEGGGVRIENDGAPLSVIGIKTEQESTVVRTIGGGTTAVLGGLVFMVNAPSPGHPPIFVNEDGTLQASFVEAVLQPGHGYQTFVRAETKGRTTTIDADAMPARGYGHLVPDLFVGAR